MSSTHHNDGVPHSRRILDTPPGVVSRQEDWSGANKDKVAKLKSRKVQKLARAKGIELRHSASGYALIDATRKPVDGRYDMTLNEVEVWLKRG